LARFFAFFSLRFNVFGHGTAGTDHAGRGAMQASVSTITTVATTKTTTTNSTSEMK